LDRMDRLGFAPQIASSAAACFTSANALAVLGFPYGLVQHLARLPAPAAPPVHGSQVAQCPGRLQEVMGPAGHRDSLFEALGLVVDQTGGPQADR
jgi:hypothetical protein